MKIFSTWLGDIRPLGIGVSGVALLAAASDEDLARVRPQHAQAFEEAGLSGATLDKAIAKAHKRRITQRWRTS